MAHSHSAATDQPLTEADKRRQSTALRWLLIVLVPLAVATLVGLIGLWPSQVSEHVDTSSTQLTSAGATEQTGRLTEVKEVSCDGQAGSVPGRAQTCAQVTIEVTNGPDRGTTFTHILPRAQYQSGARVGQPVSVYRIPLAGSDPPQVTYTLRDFERRVPLAVFGLAFALCVVAVARLRGLLSLIGLVFAFVVVVRFMLPALIEGKDPLLVGVVGSAAIMFVVLYLAHGFTLRTTTALVGTLFGLGLTAVLGAIGVRWTHLTGIGGEDDYTLAAAAPDLRLTSVVICAVIVAAMGALNDVTITQASAVWELAGRTSSKRELFASAMRIGRDHIASTVYTIAFAAAGAALPVLLLLTILERPLTETLTSELFAAEIVRTTIASIGLVLAVPVTTAIGVAAVAVGGRAGDDRYRRPEVPVEAVAPHQDDSH